MIQLHNRLVSCRAKLLFCVFVLAPTFFLSLCGHTALAQNASLKAVADDLLIKELMARYMFAMDWREPESFAATFVEDGIIEYSQGEYRGHQQLKKIITDTAARDNEQNKNVGEHKPVQRTMIHNIVTEIEGDSAKAWSYWSAVDNRTPERTPRTVSFGHYEDELVKIDGRWYFSKRVIFTENSKSKHASNISPLTNIDGE